MAKVSGLDRSEVVRRWGKGSRCPASRRERFRLGGRVKGARKSHRYQEKLVLGFFET